VAQKDDESTAREHLKFETDRGASRSTWAAGAILLAITLWMGSGFLFPAEESDAGQQGAMAPDPVAVSVRVSQAQSVTLFFQAEGQAQPDRETALLTETAGDVAEVLVAKGADVTTGQQIARLSNAQAEADLRRASEEKDRAQREFDNATALLERGVATVDRVAQARATLAAAEAQVTAAEEEMESTLIKAPFAGRLERLVLDEGEYVASGTEVGRIVDIHPLSVEIRVPQQALSRIRNGQTAEVFFITGETREGTVTFVGSAAAADTRTFLAEIRVPNEDGAIPAGISAEIRIATGQQQAHFVAPSVISLNPDGTLGIKTVEDGKVAFYQIELVRAQVDGLWVSGLPDKVDLITTGQGYVREGEAVRTHPDAADGSAPEAMQ
jgi:multidrug efflux system membrane fusion protein